MIELNERFRLLGQAAQKTHRYREAARHFIGPPAIHRLVSRVVLDAAAIGNAILMGPNARHIIASTIEAASEPIAVTLDINVLFARKPESRPAACAECARENI
jgi:glycine cleavage system aminomethyltransferase T